MIIRQRLKSADNVNQSWGPPTLQKTYKQTDMRQLK